MKHIIYKAWNKINTAFVMTIKWLGRVPTLIYLLLFLLLIFVFAFLYDSLPNTSFYHATAKYEYDYLNREADEISNQLKNEITETFVDHYGDSQVIINGWQVDISELRITSLQVKDFPEEISFHIWLPIKSIDDQRGIETVINTTVTLSLKEKIQTDDVIELFPDFSDYTRSSAYLGEALNIEPLSLEVLFQGEPPIGKTYAPALFISSNLYQRITAFGQAYRGFPSMINGHFARMLYFSAGIATSSALGDISPLTSKARSLVTLEIILSLILITLILNAIGNDIANLVKSFTEDHNE